MLAIERLTPTRDDRGRERLQKAQKIERKTFPKSEALDLALECCKANSTMLFGMVEQAVVAYLLVVRIKKAALLHKICVDESLRGNGYGRALLDAALAQLKAAGCATVELWVDAERNIARSLYTSAGFCETAMVEHYYGPQRHALKMTLDLAS